MRILLAVGVVAVLSAPADAAVRRVLESSPATVPDGSTWALAYRSVQAAIAASASGDEVWVGRGVYSERVQLSDGVRVYGGFSGTETQRAQRNPTANATILDGQGVLPNLVVARPGLTGTAVLDGFIIQNALRSGIYLSNTSPTISGNLIRNNGDDGVDCDQTTAEILNNVITGNTDDGIDVDDGAPTIRSNHITANGNDGLQMDLTTALVSENLIDRNVDDGISCVGGRPRIVRNRIVENGDDGLDCDVTEAEVMNNLIADNADMGALCSMGSPLIANNVVRGNRTHGVHCSSSPAIIVNNTFVGNILGALHLANSPVKLVNNLVAFNGYGVRFVNTDGAVARNNCVYEPDARAWAGITNPTGADGNIAANPLLVSVGSGDFHLLPLSPCINAGNSGDARPDWLDMDGDPRTVGASVDIGADEYTVAPPLSVADVAEALRLAAGVTAAHEASLSRLNVLDTGGSAGVVDALDAVKIARGLG